MNRYKIISTLTVLVILLNMILPNISFATEADKAETPVESSNVEMENTEEENVDNKDTENKEENADEDKTVVEDSTETPVETETTKTAEPEEKAETENTEGTQGNADADAQKPLTGISIRPETTIAKGKTEQLIVTYEPQDTTYKDGVKWTSSDEDVATVDENGVVTAKGTDGQTAEITATATENGVDFEATCKVTVIEIKATGVLINAGDFELGLGREIQLNAIIIPIGNTDNLPIVWSSSDTNIVTVDENGKVKAIAKGTATITATITTDAGDKTDSIEITVGDVEVERIFVSLPAGLRTIKIGEKFTLDVTINPTDATNKHLTFTSSNSNVLTILGNGEILVKGYGESVITVTADNGVWSQIKITVSPIYDYDIPNTDVTPVVSSPEKEETNINEYKYEYIQPNDSVALLKTTYISPKTGDIQIELFVGLMIVSALGIAYIITKNNRK